MSKKQPINNNAAASESVGGLSAILANPTHVVASEAKPDNAAASAPQQSDNPRQGAYFWCSDHNTAFTAYATKTNVTYYHCTQCKARGWGPGFRGVKRVRPSAEELRWMRGADNDQRGIQRGVSED